MISCPQPYHQYHPLNPAEIECILLDLGDTVWRDTPRDLKKLDAVRAVLEEYGYSVSTSQWEKTIKELINQYVPALGYALIYQFASEEDYQDIIDQFDLYLLEIVTEELTDEAEEDFRPWFPGVPETLQRLYDEGYTLGVVSNNRKGIMERFERAGIADIISYAAISREVGYHKPDPRLFLTAIKKLNCSVANTVMVGDRIDNDIHPANRLGLFSIRVNTGGMYAIQRPRYGYDVPCLELKSVVELPAILLGNEKKDEKR